MMPETNAAVPFSFCRLAKKIAVFWRPMMSVSPRMNRIWGSDESLVAVKGRRKVAYVSHGEPET